MKIWTYILIFIVGYSLPANAQTDSAATKDPNTSGRQRKFNFCFTWFEVGASIPFKENRLQNLPNGMTSYLAGSKSTGAFGLWGLGFYYKNTWGFSAIFISQEYNVPDAAFRNYVSAQYPNYYLSSAVQGHFYGIDNICYRFSYRCQKGKFAIEPQFQLGINNCKDFSNHFVLKEQGSNQFIEYDIKAENTKKNLFTYDIALKTTWCYTKPAMLWSLEPGIRLDFMLVPTNFKYTISTTPYNKPTTEVEVQVKRMRPALTITGFMSFYRKSNL